MSTFIWNTLAVIGALCVLVTVGWVIFFWRTGVSGEHDPAEPTPASEVVGRFTGNVRLVPPSSLERDGVLFLNYAEVEASGVAPSRAESYIIDGYPYFRADDVVALRATEDAS